MLIGLAIIGALCIWFVFGYVIESYLEGRVSAKPRPILKWIEITVMFGPIGIAIRVYEEFLNRH